MSARYGTTIAKIQSSGGDELGGGGGGPRPPSGDPSGGNIIGSGGGGTLTYAEALRLASRTVPVTTRSSVLIPPSSYAPGRGDAPLFDPLNFFRDVLRIPEGAAPVPPAAIEEPEPRPAPRKQAEAMKSTAERARDPLLERVEKEHEEERERRNITIGASTPSVGIVVGIIAVVVVALMVLK